MLILRYDTTIVVPGGAGNAANNVAALGGRVVLAGVAGRDEPGRRMVEALHDAREPHGARASGRAIRTPVKTRILAGGVHSAKQQVVRIDRITNGAPRRSRCGAQCRGARARRRRAAPMRCSSPTTAPGS